MDGAPYDAVLTLVGTASQSWRTLSAGWALQGIDWRSWSAAQWCDVIGELVVRAAADGDQTGSDAGRQLAAERARQRVDPDDSWGTLTADEAARIIAAG